MSETPPTADAGRAPGLTADAEPAGAPPEAGPGQPGLTADAGTAAERERLARQLRETRVQLAMTQTRLSALEESATMRFGRTIANAAKKPWPRGALLPRDLYKLWRMRGAPKSGAASAATALASAQLADLKGTGGRFLASLTAPGALPADPGLALAGLAAGAGDGLVVTGALSALGCATLAPDAIVHPLLPHDADVVLEGTGADVVVIQASALLPGEPWAYATDPAAADRGRRLARMIVMARTLGKPVVLVRDVPYALMPGIGWLAASCDAVLDGALGVQLARFNPLGVSSARPTAPVYAGARDPREAPAVRALLDALTAGGDGAAVRLAGARSWRSLPALYRENAVFVTASAAQRLEQAASGARVIGPLGSGTDAAAVRAELDAARGDVPLPPAEIRLRLRDIFLADATPARLAALVKAAELPPALVAGRQIGVLVFVSGAAQAGRLAATLLEQRLRPAEVIAACPDDAAGGGQAAVRGALGPLTRHGIRVTVTGDPGRGGGPRGAGSYGSAAFDGASANKDSFSVASFSASPAGAERTRPLARLATAGWLAPWAADGGQPADYLLDLACARECAQADAVGFGAREYEFTRWLDEPGLVRSSLLRPGGPAAGDWGSHGLRLCTITADPVAG
jgi:hypothetical protein